MSGDVEKKIEAHQQLLGEFEKPTYEEWREAAEKTLKGASFEKRLFTRLPEGVTLKPIYNEDALSSCVGLDALPGEVPYLRGTRALRNADGVWQISQESYAADPEELNKLLKRGLERGEDEINLLLDDKTLRGIDADEEMSDSPSDRGVSLCCASDFEKAFAGIDLTEQPLLVFAGESALPFVSMISAHVVSQEGVSKLSGCVGADPVGVAATRGKLDRDLASLYDEMAALSFWASKNTDDLRTVYVRGQRYHDAGAGAVEELAFALFTGVEYLRAMIERNVPVDQAAGSILFGFSAGPVFFTEVAKLRAARVLWSKIVEAFGGSKDAQKIKMHVSTSIWNQTRFDPYVNLIRSTSEVFSAAVGGADSIQASPFDEPVRGSDAFSRRIARNTQLVLQYESRLGHVVDPAGGSFYVEALTEEIATAAWTLFQDVERRGGLLKALEEGFVQSEIAETVEKKKKDLAVRKSVIVGTNMYANPTEQALETKEVDQSSRVGARAKKVAEARASVDKDVIENKLKDISSKIEGGNIDGISEALEAAELGATLGGLATALGRGTWTGPAIEPLKQGRAALMFEELREKADKVAGEKGVRPRVFLANMGPIPQHKPRADFTRGFFEVGGFEVLGNDGFTTPEEAADAAAESGAPVAVICSTDPTYPELVSPFVKRLREKSSGVAVVLAGFPKDQIEDHKKNGVDEFIHLRADIHALLNGFLNVIGGSHE